MVVRRTPQLCFLRFRTADWGPGYDGFRVYVAAAIFNEHLRPANPHLPGVMNFVQALASEAAALQQHASNCSRQANRHGAVDMGIHISESKQENGQTCLPSLPNIRQGARAPKTCAKATQGNGVKPPPKPAKSLARQRKAQVSEEDCHSLKPVRSIAGLSLSDFIR